MSQERQSRVLLTRLTECVSAKGNRYMRGWAGENNLVAFEGEPDEQGRPRWDLFLVERRPVAGAPRQRTLPLARESAWAAE